MNQVSVIQTAQPETVQPKPACTQPGVHDYDIRVVDFGKRVYLVYATDECEPQDALFVFRVRDLTVECLKVFDQAVFESLEAQCLLSSPRVVPLGQQLREVIQLFERQYEPGEQPVAFRAYRGSWGI